MEWIVLGVLGWLAVAVFAAIVVGRVIKRRDLQVPTDARAGVAPSSETGE